MEITEAVKAKVKEAFVVLDGSPEAQEFYAALANSKARFGAVTARDCGLSRAEYDQIQAAFLSQEWAQWVNKNDCRQGMTLTLTGVRVVEHLVLTARDPE